MQKYYFPNIAPRLELYGSRVELIGSRLELISSNLIQSVNFRGLFNCQNLLTLKGVGM